MLRPSCEAGDMENDIHQNGSIDLGALDDYLMSDHAPDDCMGWSDLDFFLTGIAACPEFILPSEWLPLMWGDDAPDFQTVTGACGRRQGSDGARDQRS
jgi:hypothetical protein